ncbi:Os04g0435000 [Oryza sativa Japonica Group]|uniref:Os04g0435000 protein n=1 Tax=Oryza sativa subsp. japonica TaxID=39947 RepID=A0A0N7KJ33_ORYSJ|nr:hypothetical protein EE612_023416 [Oryza sativa]BAS89297.1 Os04g0435000 [Oryza sativa Japonica Group]
MGDEGEKKKREEAAEEKRRKKQRKKRGVFGDFLSGATLGQDTHCGL